MHIFHVSSRLVTSQLTFQCIQPLYTTSAWNNYIALDTRTEVHNLRVKRSKNINNDDDSNIMKAVKNTPEGSNVWERTVTAQTQGLISILNNILIFQSSEHTQANRVISFIDTTGTELYYKGKGNLYHSQCENKRPR